MHLGRSNRDLLRLRSFELIIFITEKIRSTSAEMCGRLKIEKANLCYFLVLFLQLRLTGPQQSLEGIPRVQKKSFYAIAVTESHRHGH